MIVDYPDNYKIYEEEHQTIKKVQFRLNSLNNMYFYTDFKDIMIYFIREILNDLKYHNANELLTKIEYFENTHPLKLQRESAKVIY